MYFRQGLKRQVTCPENAKYYYFRELQYKKSPAEVRVLSLGVELINSALGPRGAFLPDPHDWPQGGARELSVTIPITPSPQIIFPSTNSNHKIPVFSRSKQVFYLFN